MVAVLKKSLPRLSSRMLALDLLRGFFIVVIIADHLWRWPNLFGYVSGQGGLWVTAGEGFVIISGLLVGYVRGYKNRDLPMLDVSKKIWKRAVLLYGWFVGLTIIYTILAWYVHFASPTTWIEIPVGNWWQLVSQTLLTLYQHDWIHFLYFYALLLATTPAIIYLLRAGKVYAVVLLTFVGYAIGRLFSIEWMEWMPMFFLPAIAGYFLPNIQARWSHMEQHKRHLATGLLYGIVGLSVVLSIMFTFLIPSNSLAANINHLMSKEFYFPVWRIPMALLWFVGFAMLFHHFRHIIDRFLGWLLLPFGMRSLTAYIVHGPVLFLIAYFLPLTPNIWYNTLICCIAVLLTWWLVTNRYIQKVVPQ